MGTTLTTVPSFGPADANLSTAVAHLRAQFPDELEALLNGRYACWLGSGLSIDRFPGLKSLVRTLLNELYQRCDFTNAECPWQRCLKDILELIHVTFEDDRIKANPDDWDDIGNILARLVDRYSDVLDQQVSDGKHNFSITYDILQLDQLYANVSVDADADHLLLAVLLAEGAFKELITTNWDGLIEKAHQNCCNGNGHRLSIVVEACDIAGSGDTKSRLTKVHGCACRCVSDPSKRALMVATRREIQNWENSHERQPIRELVRTVIRERPAIFVGLSAQDWNLQSEILAACMEAAGPLPDISRMLFAEPSLKQAQRTVISHMLGEDAYNRDRNAIEKKATLGLFAKPFLGALYLIAVRRKVDLILNAGASELTPKWQPFVSQAISDLEDWVIKHFDSLSNPMDSSNLWRQLANVLPAFIARCNRLFLKYDVPSASNDYFPLCSESVQELSDRLNLSEHPTLSWLMFVMASIHDGQRRGFWAVKSSVGSDGIHGQFSLVMSGREIAVFVVPDSGTGKAKLTDRKYLDHAGNHGAVIFYVTGTRPLTPSHALTHSLPYGTPTIQPVEIWIQELATIHPHPESLLDALKHELLCI